MDTVQNITEMKLKNFISNVNVLALEWWVAGQIVNN